MNDGGCVSAIPFTNVQLITRVKVHIFLAPFGAPEKFYYLDLVNFSQNRHQFRQKSGQNPMKDQRDSMRWKEEIFGLSMPTNPQNYLCLTILMDLNFSSIFWFLFWVVFPFFKREPLPSSQHLTVVKIAPRILFDDIPFKGDKLWLFDQITDNS